MSNAANSPFRLMSNVLLLFVNVILLVVNVIYLARQTLNSLPFDASKVQAVKDAAALGMDVCCVRNPLVLLVDKDFPRKDSFQLFDSSQDLLMLGEGNESTYPEAATRKAKITLSTDFDMSCYYSLGKEIRIHELWLSLKNESFIDLNADGFYDLRILLDRTPADRPSQVWYEDQWQDVVGGSKYQKRLRDDVEVHFDMTSGRWLSAKDKPATKRDAHRGE